MNFENLKRWHWVVIGLMVGLVIGWGVKSLNDAGGVGDAGSIGVREFERELTETNRGYPVIKNVVVHQAAGRAVVTMRRLEVDPAERFPKNPRHYRYVVKRLDARTPYIPADTSQTVDVRIDPAAELMGARAGKTAWTLSVNDERVFNWSNRLKLSGWASDPTHWSDPGNGASAEIDLRPAAYEMSIVLDASQKNLGLPSAIRASVNDYPLTGITRAAGFALPTWQCRIPAEWMRQGAPQVLKFSRTGPSVKIREIRLVDPNYSVADYLAAMHRQHPQVTFATAWWERPVVLYAIFAAAGALVIGGIWPTLLSLLVGAGFGRELPEEKPYDLSRFHGEPDPQPVKAEASGEPLDLEQLNALEEELRRSLAGQASQGDRPPAGPEPVRELSGDSSPAPVAEATHGQQDYQGEYYPVARKHGDEPHGR